MNNPMNGCQIPSLARFAEGVVTDDPLPLVKRLKRALAQPWNYQVKPGLKRLFHLLEGSPTRAASAPAAAAGSRTVPFVAGDIVRVRSREEIESTLDRWKELKGCAFLEEMWQYCGTTQTVLQVMERFLDERDYKVKKCRGILLLEDVTCRGTPVFGRCDRRCFLFWRMEWLEKAAAEQINS